MPDTTGIMGITSLTGSADALSLLSNSATRIPGVSGGNGLRQPGTGPDFTTVIDATAMSVMASAQIAPQVQAGAATPPMVTETRSYNTVEITTRTTTTRGNDYTQATGMSGPRSHRAEERLETETAFDRGLNAALSDAGAQMQEEAAEQLDVPEEQITFALQQTGLNPLDLLSEEGLTQLVTEVAGVDETALLTDGELYGELQALIETADTLKGEIAEDFGLTLEGLEEAIAQVADETPQTVQTAQTTLPVAEIPEAENAEEGVFAFAEHAGDDAELLNPATLRKTDGTERHADAEGETEADVMLKDGIGKNQAAQQTQGGTQDGQQMSQQGNRNTGAQTQTAGNAGSDMTQNANAAVNMAEGFLNAVNEAVTATQTVYGAGAPVASEAENVLRQVLEQMRTQVRPGVTELDMQLHPQSLGRVNVNLQAMDGGEMIARFTAQNETVRAALASQMPQLLQRFEEQGIKVNEVQVMVAEHGFNEQRDRNMSREDQRNEQQAGIERAGRMRRISLDLANMTADDIASLDDDTRVEAEMLAAEGTTVNYRA